jgi:hypothetical protein
MRFFYIPYRLYIPNLVGSKVQVRVFYLSFRYSRSPRVSPIALSITPGNMGHHAVLTSPTRSPWSNWSGCTVLRPPLALCTWVGQRMGIIQCARGPRALSAAARMAHACRRCSNHTSNAKHDCTARPSQAVGWFDPPS